jgi:hypothetical protein
MDGDANEQNDDENAANRQQPCPYLEPTGGATAGTHRSGGTALARMTILHLLVSSATEKQYGQGLDGRASLFVAGTAL